MNAVVMLVQAVGLLVCLVLAIRGGASRHTDAEAMSHAEMADVVSVAASTPVELGGVL